VPHLKTSAMDRLNYYVSGWSLTSPQLKTSNTNTENVIEKFFCQMQAVSMVYRDDYLTSIVVFVTGPTGLPQPGEGC